MNKDKQHKREIAHQRMLNDVLLLKPSLAAEFLGQERPHVSEVSECPVEFENAKLVM